MEQAVTRQAATIAEELVILAPMKAGESAGNCDAALADARSRARGDLVQYITRICAPVEK